MANEKEWNIPIQYKSIYSHGLHGKHIDSNKKKEFVSYLRELFRRVEEQTYEQYFHQLLWFEEKKERECLKKQSVKRVKLQETTSIRKFNIHIPGMEQKQRYVRIGDSLLLKSPSDSTRIYAKIEEIDVRKNILIIILDKSPRFRIWASDEFELEFCFSNHQYVSMHEAVENTITGVHLSKVFPNKNIKCNIDSISKWFNTQIARNPEQRAAVEHIVAKTSAPAPFILHGPPGTGKTATIVEAILQVLMKDSSNKVMVCTPSNSAADDVACKLIKYEPLFPIEIFLSRRNSSKRDWDTLPQSLIKYSKDYILRNTTLLDEKKAIQSEISAESKRTRIIVSTISYAPQATGYISNKQSPSMSDITHLFIDEAAQATEPLTLVPISNLLKPDGLLVLSGDPLQLGPVLNSQHAKDFGFDISLMERLTKQKLYSSKDPNYTIMLKRNYRSHPDILQIPNKEFYNGQLQACAANDIISTRNIWKENQRGRAIVFHAVFGQEEQEKLSSSYFNKMELEMLKYYILKLTAETIREDPKNIGIITPYTAQVNKIRKWLDNKGLNAIEVGSVESYQGREKKIILMSTVRGQGKCSTAKVKLGFLADSKRFNVALTRAKSKLVVIGNPNCLKKDKMWRIYIEKCEEIGSYDEKYVEDCMGNMLNITSEMQKLQINRRK